MTSKIAIPNPCSKKWDELSGKSSKRFCGACSKHVHDFTQMETEEIIQFLKIGKGSMCGVFTNTQIHQMSFKEKIIYSVKEHKKNPVKLSTVLATIVFLAMLNFFSSCVQKTMGETVSVNTEYVEGFNTQIPPADTLPKCDSSKVNYIEMGEIEIFMGDTTIVFDSTEQQGQVMGKIHMPSSENEED